MYINKISIIHLVLTVPIAVFSLFASTVSIAEITASGSITKGFPSDSSAQTSWSFDWSISEGRGLEIQNVTFQTSPTSIPKVVLYDAAVQELFVTYHEGSPRFLDFSFGFFMATLDSVRDCKSTPTQTATLLRNDRNRNVVCMEVRDRGLAWKNGSLYAQGKELVLWSMMNAYNYNYIFEWTFRDDGVIQARLGATGENFPDDPAGHHNHSVFWRFDFDMNGEDNDSAYIGRHIENTTQLTSVDTEELIQKETGIVWDPYEFMTLIIRDATQTNANGNSSSYRLIPNKGGITRHKEKFTHNDFWVLAYKDCGFLCTAELDVTKLHRYAKNENVEDTDIVVWYMDTFHHVTRSEDGDYAGGPLDPIATQIEWVGVTIKPYNVFDSAPLTQQ